MVWLWRQNSIPRLLGYLLLDTKNTLAALSARAFIHRQTQQFHLVCTWVPRITFPAQDHPEHVVPCLVLEIQITEHKNSAIQFQANWMAFVFTIF